MSSRDERRRALRERLEADYMTNATEHIYRESAAFPGTCLCGMLALHPVHAYDDSSEPVPNVPEAVHGVMIALYPSPDVANELALKSGELPSELHLTLAYMGDQDEVGDIAALSAVIGEFVSNYTQPLVGEVSGMGVFTNPTGAVTYASVDIPTLPDFRQDLVNTVESAGFIVSKVHGYTPHITLAYADLRNTKIVNVPLVFNSVTLACGGDKYAEFSLLPAETTPPGDPTHAYIPGIYAGGPNVPCATCGMPPQGDMHSDYAPAQTSADAEEDETPSDDPAIKAPDKKALTNHDYVNPSGPQDYNGVYPPCDLCNEPQNALIHGNTGVDDLVDTSTIVTTIPKIAVVTTYLTGPNSQGPGDTDGNILDGKRKNATIMTTNQNPGGFLAVNAEREGAFVSEVNGHTLITAPAAAFAGMFETATTTNQHMQWIQGNLVGAEKANKNGAFWSTGDLEMGLPTVQHGPINWLHEGRHVIGSIADSNLVTHQHADDQPLQEPYIAIAAAIWKWLYPDEAQVIQQASDQDALRLSMECVSDQVRCIGSNGCGQSFDYNDYMRKSPGVCQHIIDGSSTRQLVNPTFLGAAIIVPPVRPGWPGAKAQVMKRASAMAEKAFEDAGNPNISAALWEQLMASVVMFGESL